MKIDFDVMDSIKGFMDKQEAALLHQTALQASKKGPVLEIGSYCGKSAYIIGTACRENSGILFSIDHHQGSEEQQPGEEYYDPELFDEKQKRINTLPFFQRTIRETLLEETVVPIVATSELTGSMWATPLSMVFIDGGHSFEAAHTDYTTWSEHIMENGFLVIHDIFFDPAKGGQAPRQIYEKALESGHYREFAMSQTLGVLEKYKTAC